jgi:hypothetical protein
VAPSQGQFVPSPERPHLPLTTTRRILTVHHRQPKAPTLEYVPELATTLPLHAPWTTMHSLPRPWMPLS